MSSEIEEAIETVAPEIGVPLKLARWAVYVLIGLSIAALVIWVVWKLFFAEHAAQVKHDEVQAHAQAAVGAAEGSAGAHAANVVATGSTKETIIHDTTHTNTIEISRQPGAGDLISPDVDAAFRKSVCMRASAAGLPDCQRLPEAGP